jgi:hypothetical protein
MAEVRGESGDMPSGDTLGFMWVTIWATSEHDFLRKLTEYLVKYRWTLLSTEQTQVVDPSVDRGDVVNRMIDETLADTNAVRLGTFFSYKPNWEVDAQV